MSNSDESFTSRSFDDWIRHSTIHGIPKIFNKQLPISVRIFWLIASVCMAGLGVYLIWSQVILFFQYQVSTQINSFRDVTTEFPAITFCNINFFNTNEGEKYSNETLKSFNPSRNNLFNKSKVKDIENKLKFLRSSLIKNDSLINKSSFGLDFNQMFLSCYFGSVTCDINDFEYVFDINLGNCYRFNFNKSQVRKVITSGDKSGLQLGLYLGDQDKYNSLSHSFGIYLTIHNKSYKGILSTNGIELPVGRETKIGIKRNIHKKLDSPYSDCIKNIQSTSDFYSELFSKTIEMAGTYNKIYCFKLCIQRRIMNNCLCFDPDYPVYNKSYNSCIVKNENCSTRVVSNTEDDETFKNDCDSQCPTECDRIELIYAISSNEFPTISYGFDLISMLNINMTNSTQIAANYTDYLKLQRSVLRFSVYYDTLTYDFISESPSLTFLNFVLNIGYTFGLCYGISCIGLCETIEIIAYLLTHMNCFNRPKKPKRLIKTVW